MKHQIARISVHQTSMVLGIAYALLGLLFVPLVWFASFADASESLPIWGVLVFPVLYGVFGYVFTAIFCAFYNLVASLTGGIEFSLRALDSQDTSF